MQIIQYILNFFKKEFNKIFKSEFSKNVLTLFTGASIAQIIPFLVAPILSRIYTPENFGELGILVSVVGIFSIIATFQYEAAIMLPQKDEDAFNILALALVITLIISSLSYIVTFSFSQEIAQILKSKTFENWTFIIPIFVFLAGSFNALNIWTSRKKQYKRLAIKQITQSSIGAVTKLLFGWLKYFNSGLILGTIFGQISSTGILALKTIKDNKTLFKVISRKKMLENAKIYSNFPKYTMWQGFFDLINASGVIFILSSFYGVEIVGLYTFTLTILKKPSQMIGNSISQVFYQNASKKAANGESIYSDALKLIKNLGIIGTVIFLPFIALGTFIFSFVFGNKWAEAGLIAQIISPWLFLRFIASPLTNIAMIKNKQKEFLFITTSFNLLIPLFFFIFGFINIKFQYAFCIISIFATIYLSAIIYWILQLSKKR